MNEAEAVKTTIVGGRPPGCGRNSVPVPRRIEPPVIIAGLMMRVPPPNLPETNTPQTNEP
jgi:hypothetical protein